jgi:hypothetical protein
MATPLEQADFLSSHFIASSSTCGMATLDLEDFSCSSFAALSSTSVKAGGVNEAGGGSATVAETAGFPASSASLVDVGKDKDVGGAMLSAVGTAVSSTAAAAAAAASGKTKDLLWWTPEATSL